MHSWSTLSGRISARVARGRHDYRGNPRGLSRSRTRRYPGCTGLRRASRPYQPSRAAQRVKFLVDAQLPSRFGRWLHERGHDALHTLETPGGNRTPDLEIVALAARKGRIVVTKDSDFVQSFCCRANHHCYLPRLGMSVIPNSNFYCSEIYQR